MAVSMAPSVARSCGLTISWRASGTWNAGQLLQRDGRAVVLDDELLDEGRSGPPGAHRRELVLHVLDGLVHLLDGVEQRLFGHARQRTEHGGGRPAHPGR